MNVMQCSEYSLRDEFTFGLPSSNLKRPYDVPSLGQFKLEALRRMEAGENVSVLARKLGFHARALSQWRNRYRLGGSTLCAAAAVSAHEEKPAAEEQPAKEARQTALEEQARAQRRIAALECKVGQ